MSTFIGYHHLPPMSDSKFLELCKSSDTKKLKEAILNGTNVNAKDNDGCTALMKATTMGYIETAELLLKHGANINAKDIHYYTALTWAEFYGRTETADLLRKYGGAE